MITAQNIREKTFDKATFGGYDITGVDDYLEELAADVTATQKEIATLRGKMKVLVDKIEEYRANEDAMRMALVSAQKLSAQIEEEANARAQAILDEARAQADAMVAEAQAKVDAVTGDLTELRTLEERRLSAAKEANTAYFEKAFANLERQNEFLRAIQAMGSETEECPAGEAPAAVAVEEAPADEEIPAVEEASAAEEIPAAEEAPVEPAVPEADDEVDEPTRMFRF